ncbi:hypothetical protein QYE76_002274 [Lolium multiflorum]|uniref:Reverse transcriptase Ty1/copia-type domain-containing protein n=1 Tax=Lolium multiflorum TaxID=4521 RepID=A0AAD8RMV9_LOLMU|nr:hypothetical protein QYE76_002274 [Lolium multiflorum]
MVEPSSSQHQQTPSLEANDAPTQEQEQDPPSSVQDQGQDQTRIHDGSDEYPFNILLSPNNVQDQAHDDEHSQEIEEAQVEGQDGDPNDQVDQVIPPRPRRTKEEIEACRLARRDRNLEILEHTHEKVLSDLMTDRFEMSMMGEMRFFLGFEIKQLREGTFINQAKYLQDMLKRFKMTEMKGVATPMVTKCHLALDPNGVGGPHRSNSGKRAVPADFEAEVLPVKKMSRREKGFADTEPRHLIIKRLHGTPIGKWPDNEAHNTPKPIEKALLADLYLEGEVVYGSQKFLRPVYDILLRIYREVLNPKVGCVDQIYGYLGNLLLLSHQHRDTGMQLDVMDFLWNEFWSCIMSRKSPVFAPYFMCFICSRWENAGYGKLLDDVNHLPHKPKDLKVKAHPLPPRLPGDDESAEEDSDMEYVPPADSGWFARIEAKLAKMFCLKSDINRRQYQAHRERKMERRNTKLIMRKLDIPVESGSEEVITPEEEWLSKHGNVTEFEQLGLPDPSRRQRPSSDDEDSEPEPVMRVVDVLSLRSTRVRWEPQEEGVMRTAASFPQ